MAGSKEIKRRIKSVKSTKKITKAMELVAASKMKRAVASTLASRLYAEYSWEVLVSIGKSVEEITHPLFTNADKRGQDADSRRILLILITSNRGLCGAYNSQVIKKTLALLRKNNNGADIDILTVGKKGDVAMRRIGQKIIASFTDLPAYISLGDVLPISKLAIQEFTSGTYDTVLVAYTDFVSAMAQVPNIKQVIPVSKNDLKGLIAELGAPTSEAGVSTESVGKAKVDYLIEGDKNILLGSLAEKLVRMQIYQMLLESNASEQSSRMVAMKNASEAAGEMIEDLTLVFNKARQANITQEISEISAGMASVS
ncbi:MAG: ATP synthase gamma chain [Parcubacteria group bacterium GW2011_GWA2_49_9]|nr:MAG: ATP synthase gamma chain [Parcubacteria group bacterium GW2011_GWA2_49_9]